MNRESSKRILTRHLVAIAVCTIVLAGLIVLTYAQSLTLLGVGGPQAQTTVPHAITFQFNSAGGSLSTGSSQAVTIPFACTINHWDISANAGTATVQFWKIATGTAIPTSANSISMSGVSLATGTSIRSATLTDFTTTTVSVGDIMIANLGTVSGASWVTAEVECQ